MALPIIAGAIPVIGAGSQPEQHSRLSYRWLASSPLYIAPVLIYLLATASPIKTVRI
jgi:hypothetical protein